MIRKALQPLARAWRPAASVASIVVLAACASLPPKGDTPDSGELLRNSLPVAAAALAAGQADVARRLYLSLAERYADAPEPLLGLGYTALYGGEFASARSLFLRAAERAGDRPALRSEARLAAGRAALAEGRIAEAGRILRSARGPARGTPAEPWVANGLGVVASLEADYQVADTRFREALALSSENPRITANLVQMLLAAGRVDDAARPARRPATRPGGWMTTAGPSPASSRNPARGPPDDAPATFGRAAAAGPGHRLRAPPGSSARRGPGGRGRPRRLRPLPTRRTRPVPRTEPPAPCRRGRDRDFDRLPGGRRRAAPLAERALRHRQGHRAHLDRAARRERAERRADRFGRA